MRAFFMPVAEPGNQWYLETCYRLPGTATMSRLLLVLLLSLPIMVAAQVYRSVDENGNAVFSDTPPTDGSSSEKLSAGTTNTLAPPPQVHRPGPVIEEKKVEYKVEIVEPLQDTTIPLGYVGNFSVNARVIPALPGGASAQLHMDGAPAGEPKSALSWTMNNTFRGTHILTVTITDGDGSTLAVSGPRTVHVMRASIAR
jgi:hypothetical protein